MKESDSDESNNAHNDGVDASMASSGEEKLEVPSDALEGPPLPPQFLSPSKLDGEQDDKKSRQRRQPATASSTATSSSSRWDPLQHRWTTTGTTTAAVDSIGGIRVPGSKSKYEKESAAKAEERPEIVALTEPPSMNVDEGPLDDIARKRLGGGGPRRRGPITPTAAGLEWIAPDEPPLPPGLDASPSRDDEPRGGIGKRGLGGYSSGVGARRDVGTETIGTPPSRAGADGAAEPELSTAREGDDGVPAARDDGALTQRTVDVGGGIGVVLPGASALEGSSSSDVGGGEGRGGVVRGTGGGASDSEGVDDSAATPSFPPIDNAFLVEEEEGEENGAAPSRLYDRIRDRIFSSDTVLVVEGTPIQRNSDKEMSHGGHHRKKWPWALLVCFIAAAAAIGLSLSLTSSGPDEAIPTAFPTDGVSHDITSCPSLLPSTSSTPSEDPTQQPSTSPSESHVPSAFPSEQPSFAPTSDRFQVLMPVALSVSDEDTLVDTSSPQYRALEWLADDDETAIHLSIDDPRLVTRYVLAVLYFSTGGPTSWIDKLRFTSSYHECSWNRKEELEWTFGNDGVMCERVGDDLVLYYLVISQNDLTGTLPNELGNLSDLHSIYLNMNSLTGPIPSSLQQLSNLWALDLRFNKLNGTIPSWVGNLFDLSVLLLDFNEFSGPIPSSIGQLSKLESLFLDENNLTGQIPPSIFQLAKLKALTLSSNHFTGTLPTSVHLPELNGLAILKNLLSGSIPSSFSSMSNLYELALDMNFFTGTLPLELSSMSKLSYLSLSDNRFNGTVPEWLGDMPTLTSLNLADNYLHGTIPSLLGNLHDLFGLGLQINNLTGTIPTELGRLVELDELALSENPLRGRIPTEFGFLAKLRRLVLQYSCLTGSVPSELGSLANMEWMALDNNILTGTLPHTFANFVQDDEPVLGVLYLHKNSLTGNLTFLCEGNGNITILKADCAGPDPEIVCQCCNECCDREGDCKATRPTK